MKAAVVGSRSLFVDNIGKYIPGEVTEIISGGAKGIDECAEDFALKNGIKFTLYLPEFKRYGKAAPLKRKVSIIKDADIVIALWDGKSKGTENAISIAEKLKKPLKIYIIK
ncbi:MAG: hypothetical protein IJF29_00455 [Firmicutes bacterium]|nr:hypothetical protein [Bacillota bacterium]